jgi:hypothetical protein
VMLTVQPFSVSVYTHFEPSKSISGML